MSFIPGFGIAKGMGLTLRRFFAPKATIQYPETTPDVAVRFRGRLQLLYDELGNVKCETCFQCAQACPVECIDMGGFDTKGRFHVHWGAAEQYAERREESAVRRSGRPVPDTAYEHFAGIDTSPVDAILKRRDFDHKQMLPILEEIQGVYGYLPVAALKRLSQASGAPYALIFGTATYYRQFRFDKPERSGGAGGTGGAGTGGSGGHVVAVCRCTTCALAGAGRVARTLAKELDTEIGRSTAAGAVALESLPAHIAGTASPLVTLDGKPQAVTPAGVAAWARTLTGATPAAGTGAATAARTARAAKPAAKPSPSGPVA